VHKGGTAIHWPFFVAGSLPTPHSAPAYCQQSTLQQCHRSLRAPGATTVSSSEPRSAADMAQSSDLERPKMPVKLPGENQSSDTLWNSLPEYMQDLKCSVDSYRQLLKTFLFSQY